MSEPGGSRERISEALRAARAGTWHWDTSTGRITWDAELEAVHGLAPGTFGGTYADYLALIHPDDRAAARDQWRRRVDGEDERYTEHRVVRPDGEVVWVMATGRLLRDARHRVVGMAGIGMDLTHRHRLEAGGSIALRSSDVAQLRLRLLARAESTPPL